MTFEQLQVQPSILKELNKRDIKKPTKIQTETIPLVMDGKDILAQSATGSGKTLAFLIPIFHRIQKGGKIQALVITPTRELAIQITEEANKFSDFNTVTVYGGAAIGPQERDVRKAEIIVGTPGRLLDLMERGSLEFPNLKFLVLDEADRMLSMGFIEDVERIMVGHFQTEPIGKDFGVILVVSKEEDYEVATFRTDIIRDRVLSGFIEYIKQIKPKDFEKRLNLLLKLSLNK